MLVHYFLRRHAFEGERQHGEREYWYEIMERKKKFPLAVETARLIAVVRSEATGRIMVDELNRQRVEGVLEGMRRFAWWKDGTEYVGTCGTPLARAFEDVRKEMA